MESILSFLENKYRSFFPKRIKSHKLICKIFTNKKGIEIGGPSSILGKKGFLPIYNYNLSLDNANFSNQTIWEGNLIEGNQFKIDKSTFKQLIREASNLRQIEDSTYEFLISSHNIEHLANPLKAIIEWKRVVKPNGYFLFILPNKEGTFDHKRPVTTIDHLIDDLNKNTEESDDTHFEEILKLHDLSRDPGGLSFEDFYKRTIKNYENRCVHHHVFNLSLLEEIAKYSKIKILHLTKFSKIHLVLIGENIK